MSSLLRRVAWGSTALAFASSIAVYSWLPALVPTHFDLAGHPDNFAPRLVGAFVLPVFMIVANIVERGARGVNPAITITTSMVCAFFLALHVLVLRAALTGAGLGDGMWLLLGAFFVALGLVLPRVRRNLWVGVRTPWAMRSPEVWARTQRVGGATMIASGAVFMLSSFGTGTLTTALRVFALLVGAIVPIVYSWRTSRTLGSP